MKKLLFISGIIGACLVGLRLQAASMALVFNPAKMAWPQTSRMVGSMNSSSWPEVKITPPHSLSQQLAMEQEILNLIQRQA